MNGFKKTQRHQLLHSLGNLVLISVSKNSKLQNQCFEYKKKHEDAAGNLFGFTNGSYSEIEVAQYDDWNPEYILKRGMKLLEFMEQRWNIEIDNKEVLLQLSLYYSCYNTKKARNPCYSKVLSLFSFHFLSEKK